MRRWGLLSLVGVVVALGVAAPSPDSAAAADLDCADFASQAEAQENLLPGDPHGLDADSDGIACESNPCPCGGEPESSAPQPPAAPKPPPYRLSKAAAKAEAKRLAWRFVRRNSQVDSLAFGGCRRLGARRVDCAFSARGSTPTARTTCRVEVAVRSKNRQPTGQLSPPRCHTESILVLSYARARQALLETGSAIAGKRVGVELRRFNRLEFEGWAEWGRRSISGASERCSLEMTAELSSSNVLRVQTGQQPICSAL